MQPQKLQHLDPNRRLDTLPRNEHFSFSGWHIQCKLKQGLGNSPAVGLHMPRSFDSSEQPG